MGRGVVDSTFTLATEIFGIEAKSEREATRLLDLSIERLRQKGLLPELGGRRGAPAPSTPALLKDKRTRSNFEASGLVESSEPSGGDELAARRRRAIENADCVTSQSDARCVVIMMVEQLVLSEAFESKKLCDLYASSAERTFTRGLNDFVMERACECGVDFPYIFLSSGVNANATELIPAPQQPLRENDLAYLWHRYCRSNCSWTRHVASQLASRGPLHQRMALGSSLN